MASERLWLYALVPSTVLHLVLIGTAAAWAAGAPVRLAAGVRDAAPLEAGQLAGETFEVEGLVDAPAGVPVSEAVGWLAGGVRELGAAMGPALAHETRATPAPAPKPRGTAEASPPDPSPNDVAHPSHAPSRVDAPPSTPGAAPSAEADSRTEERHATPAAPEGAAGQGRAPAPSAAARRYGAPAHRDGVLLLAPAVARAIPAAVSADPIWSELPLGPVGAVELDVVVDTAGSMSEVTSSPRPPEPLRRLVVRTLAVLRAGRFALTGATGAGRETIRIEVILSQRSGAARAGGSGSSRSQLELGFDPPAPDRPGRAWFTLGSGRHFEARIALVRSVPAREATGQPPAGADLPPAAAPSGAEPHLRELASEPGGLGAD